MKKLLILMLVFGLASVTFGADIRDDFKLEMVGSTVYVVGLAAVAESFSVYDEAGTINSFSSGVVLGDGSGGNAGGALASINLFSGTGYDGFDMTTGDTPEPTDAVDLMNWFSVSYDGSVGDIVNVYDPYPTLIGTMEIVPEPATVALLALGGLLLRRRK